MDIQRVVVSLEDKNLDSSVGKLEKLLKIKPPFNELKV